MLLGHYREVTKFWFTTVQCVDRSTYPCQSTNSIHYCSSFFRSHHFRLNLTLYSSCSRYPCQLFTFLFLNLIKVGIKQYGPLKVWSHTDFYMKSFSSGPGSSDVIFVMRPISTHQIYSIDFCHLITRINKRTP